MDEQYFEQMARGHERANHAVQVVYTKNESTAGADENSDWISRCHVNKQSVVHENLTYVWKSDQS